MIRVGDIIKARQLKAAEAAQDDLEEDEDWESIPRIPDPEYMGPILAPQDYRTQSPASSRHDPGPAGNNKKHTDKGAGYALG